MKHAATYRQLRPLYDQYRQSRDKEKFLRGHEGEIILFEAAARELKRLDAVPLPATKRLRAEMDELTARKYRPAIGISKGPAGGTGVRHPPPECGGPAGKAEGDRTAETAEQRTGITGIVRFAGLFKGPWARPDFICIMEAGMEVLPMTRTEAIKEFFKKAVLPIAIAGLLYCIFKSACMRDGELDLLWLWILCGLPFGIHRMCVWIVPGGGSLGGGAALFVLNFVIGGLIGGFVLVWRLLVAAWYVPLTVYRLIVG